MESALHDLASIPYLGKDEARKMLAEHFDTASGILKGVLAVPGLSIDAFGMHGLFKLCKRLVDRYLVLVRIPVVEGQASEVVFSYD